MIRPSAFFRCFMLNSLIQTESQTTGADCSNSVDHDQVKVLSYCKYSLLFLPGVGIEPSTPPDDLAKKYSIEVAVQFKFLRELPNLTWNT